MEFLKKIKFLLWIVVFFGAITAYVDYNRLLDGDLPVFCKDVYDPSSRIETFRGIFYIAERQVKRDPNEALALSSEVQYRFLNQKISIQPKAVRSDHSFVLYVTPSESCPGEESLYQELEGKNIYFDCISSIRIKNINEKDSKDLKDVLLEDSSVLDDLLLEMSFTGIEEDQSTERYVVEDSSFATHSFYLYRCHQEENHDIHISMNSEKRDYCSK